MRLAALPAEIASQMAGATIAAPRTNGALTLTLEKINAAQKGPTPRASAPRALFRPMIWPWWSGSMLRDIRAPELGKATEEPMALQVRRAIAQRPSGENGCSAVLTAVIAIPTASMRASP